VVTKKRRGWEQGQGKKRGKKKGKKKKEKEEKGGGGNGKKSESQLLPSIDGNLHGVRRVKIKLRSQKGERGGARRRGPGLN